MYPDSEAYKDCGDYNGIMIGNTAPRSPPAAQPSWMQLPDSDDEEFRERLEEPTEIDVFLAGLGLRGLSPIFKVSVKAVSNIGVARITICARRNVYILHLQRHEM